MKYNNNESHLNLYNIEISKNIIQNEETQTKQYQWSCRYPHRAQFSDHIPQPTQVNKYANEVKNIADKVNNYANEVKNIADQVNNYANEDR